MYSWKCIAPHEGAGEIKNRLFSFSLVLVATGAFLLATFRFGRAMRASTEFPQAARSVTSTADSGPGSLRQALTEAQAGDTILFDPVVFPPARPATIFPLSQLPAITSDNLTIDASNAGAIIDGSAAGGELTPGLNIQASGVTVHGLQIVSFSGCGIEVHGHGNIIGGDRLAGAGPLGQGNLLGGSKNHSGIGLFNSGAYSNTIQGNLIGVDVSGMAAWKNAGDGVHINGAHHNLIIENVLSGNGGSGIQGCCTTDSSHNVIRQNMIGVGIDGTTPVPNELNGVWFHDGASLNVIGPGNILAHNSGVGVQIDGTSSLGNTITHNQIRDNQWGGIDLSDSGNGNIPPPIIMEFDLSTGLLTGYTCSGCQVEIYSDDEGQGKWFEGQLTANSAGYFAMYKGSAFTGPHLTTTATDNSGNTSEFSPPTSGTRGSAVLQTGNTNPPATFHTKRSTELVDNGFGNVVSGMWNLPYLSAPIDCAAELGIKIMRATIQEGDSTSMDWTKPELYVDPSYDVFFTMTIQAGMVPIYNLIFWDKAWHESGNQVPVPRFQTQEEIDRYLEYVEFIVNHFKDRIDYYELWNEPTNEGTIMTIDVEDYVNLATQTIPRIKALDPGARVVVGSVSGMGAPHLRAFLLSLIENEAVMSMADVVSWHPFFGDSPQMETSRVYYAEYPSLVQSIQQTARAHGFTGQFRADEFVYNSPDECPAGTLCGPVYYLYSDSSAAKYYARAILLHAGMNVAPGPLVGCHRKAATPTKILATILAGAEAESFPFELTTTVTDVLSYTFSLSGDGRMVTFWDHGAAMDDYSPTESTLRLPSFGEYAAYGIDVLSGYQQPLIARNEDDTLIIENLRLRDYPILIRLSPIRRLYLPVVVR